VPHLLAALAAGAELASWMQMEVAVVLVRESKRDIVKYVSKLSSDLLSSTSNDGSESRSMSNSISILHDIMSDMTA
jgi:hypothetical protein